MAIWLNPLTGEFTTDGNWSSTTVSEDGTVVEKVVRNGVIVAGAVRRNTWDLLGVAFRNPRETVWAVIRHPRIAALGFIEGRGDLGVTFSGEPWSETEDLRDDAYDMGRALRRLGWDER